jgi:hypothetical protein
MWTHGDKIVCVKDKGLLHIRKDKVYTVHSIDRCTGTVNLKEISGTRYKQSRFKLVPESIDEHSIF